VDFLIEVFPVENMGHPSKGVCTVEEHGEELPRPAEGVDEEQVVSQRD
jgi:hypothetical protein